MEPVTLGIIVAALIAKGLDRAEDGVVDGAVQAARKAVKALRGRFTGDREAEQAIDRLVEAPDNEERKNALAAVLEDRAAGSTELRAEMQAIVEQFKGAGVRIGDIEQTAEGNENVQNAGIANSQITISRGPGSGTAD